MIVAHAGGPDTPTYPPARRVSFSELLGIGYRLAWTSGATAGDLAGEDQEQQ
jgi:hypothetical protein